MDDISIEELTHERLQEAMDVAVSAFEEKAREDANIDFPSKFNGLPRPYAILTAVCDGKVIGTVHCTHGYLNVNIYNITWLCVAPEYQGQGVGTKIMKAACSYIENNFLKGKAGTIFLTAESGVEKLYERFGFKIISMCHDGNPAMMKIVEGK